MGSTTELAWTDATWNPIVGCTPASPGCANCYAREMHDRRHKARVAGKRLPEQYARPFSAVQMFAERLSVPLHWKKPRRVFVCSTADLFHPDVPDSFIAAVFGAMAKAPWHTFQVLTKRAERMLRWFRRASTGEGRTAVLRGAQAHRWPDWYMREVNRGAPAGETWPLPNVWLGVTVENQQAADERVPLLLQTPAALRFLSCEPLLGPVDLAYTAFNGTDSFGSMPGLDWVIVGGESGPRARPMALGWARSLVGQCREAGVPCFVKQLGRRPRTGYYDEETRDECEAGNCEWPDPIGWSEHDGQPGLDAVVELKLRSLDGRDPAEWPADLRVQEWPEVQS